MCSQRILKTCLEYITSVKFMVIFYNLTSLHQEGFFAYHETFIKCAFGSKSLEDFVTPFSLILKLSEVCLDFISDSNEKEQTVASDNWKECKDNSFV